MSPVIILWQFSKMINRAAFPPSPITASLSGSTDTASTIVETTSQIKEQEDGSKESGIVVGEKVLSNDEVVDLLIDICRDSPDGIWPDSIEEKKVKEIGEAINKAGGMELMRFIHSQFAERNRWLARSIESSWGGIGQWVA